MSEELEPIDVSKYEITETGQVLKVSKKEMSDMKDRASEYLRRQTQLNGGGLFHCNILNLVLGFAEQETKELQKENAELNEKLKDLERNMDIVQDIRELAHSRNGRMKKQLTKAKELLNEFLDFESSCMERGIYISDKIRAEAEQFLNSEVEK